MANSLLDVIRSMFSGNQTDFNTLSKQFEAMSAQLQQPSSLPRAPQQQPIQPQTQPRQTNQASQTPLVIKQPFPDYHSGTIEAVIDPFTGEIVAPPKVYPSESHPVDYPRYKNAEISSSTTKTKSTKPTKKALTPDTIKQSTGVNSSIPILPYTTEGFIGAVSEALKQGKITPFQAQQLLHAIAPQELSAEDIYTTLEKKIKELPVKFEDEKKKVKIEMDQAYNELKNNLDQQVKITKKYADKEIEWIEKRLQKIEEVFTNLMKEKPNLEPDKWTLFGRQLAMALGSISALVHPGYAPYFYMAIPQIVQYWQNEDAHNFEKAMKKFELALKLAGIQLDFYNQIMEHNLKILEKKKEKKLLPLTLTEMLLSQKYFSLVDLYNKMEAESYKVSSDEIANLMAVADLKEKARHHRIIEELNKERNKLMEKRMQLEAMIKNASLAIKNAFLKIAQEKHALQKDMLLHPNKYLGKILPSIMGKSSSVQELAKVLQLLNQSKDLEEWINELTKLGIDGED